MLVLQILGLILIGCAIGKLLSIHLDKENENLKAQLVRVKAKRVEEKEKYQERIHMMNDAFDQFKKGQ